MAKKSDNSEELLQKIAVTVEELLHRKDGSIDYYGAMEKLLHNYKTLERIVRDEEAYMTIELTEKSKSITGATVQGGGYRDREDLMDEMQKERERAYAQTCRRYEEIDRVVRAFCERREFIVIRMYYFKEDPEGNARDAAPYTWEEITQELSERGLLRTEKTARMWRSRIVADMAVCLFGAPAAMHMQRKRGREE